MPSNYRFEDGSIWDGDQVIQTPEEQDVFKLFGMEFILPDKRMVGAENDVPF